MKVKLLRYTPDPEKLCAAAAMTSYKSEGTARLFKDISIERARKTIRRVLGYGHYSVIEHASFTFSVEGISRALTHQLVRHRIASYTQQSQRYVTYDTLEHYVAPRSISETEEAKETYEDALRHISDAYQKLLKLSVPKEDARFLLPNAAKTNILITMNARELRHFFNLRCCERSQWEIREMAIEMLRQAKQLAPSLFENAGPSCVELGYCPEGELKPSACKIDEIKRKFKEL
ncbi:MAG: FAD-dependent thymidylate synthase [Candidatus Bathyarchaeia archaeon]